MAAVAGGRGYPQPVTGRVFFAMWRFLWYSSIGRQVGVWDCLPGCTHRPAVFPMVCSGIAYPMEDVHR